MKDSPVRAVIGVCLLVVVAGLGGRAYQELDRALLRSYRAPQDVWPLVAVGIAMTCTAAAFALRLGVVAFRLLVRGAIAVRATAAVRAVFGALVSIYAWVIMDRFLASGHDLHTLEPNAPTYALVIGFVCCGMMAYDVPARVLEALRLLRSDIPDLPVSESLSDLTDGAYVHLVGRVEEGPARSFLLERAGARVHVEAPAPAGAAGREAHVFGKAVVPARTLFRGALPHVVAGSRPLLVVVDPDGHVRDRRGDGVLRLLGAVVLATPLLALPALYAIAASGI